MQYYIGNVTCDIYHVTHPDKWHVNKMYYSDILQICLLYHSVFTLYPKSPRHHLLVETNSTHVASTRALLEVEGGINGIEFRKKLPPKLGHIPGGLAFLEFVLLKFGPPWSNHI